MAATCARVQLGVFDGPCPSLRLSAYENKIGGYPDFFTECTLSSPPRCKLCGGTLALLVQVYSPLEGSPYHRLLHIYCCTQPVCWPKSECWLVLRSQQRDPLSYEVNQEKEPEPSTTSTDRPKEVMSSAREWCEDVDDWGDGGDGDWGDDGEGDWGGGSEGDCADDGEGDRCNSGVSDISDNKDAGLSSHLVSSTISEEPCVECIHVGLKAKDLMKCMSIKETSGKNVGLPLYKGPYYPPGFISVIEESDAITFKVEEVEKKYQHIGPDCDFMTNGLASEQEGEKNTGHHRQRGRREKSSRHGNAGDSGEIYEKGVAKHGDKTFQKFHKQLSNFSQQILRYSWNGSPVLFTGDPSYLPPKESALVCKECGGVCSFELQLMPTLVYVLNQCILKKKLPKDFNQGEQSLLKEKVVEFGTVLVYSCSVSCWEKNLTGSAQFREGICVVQPELDTINKLL